MDGKRSLNQDLDSLAGWNGIVVWTLFAYRENFISYKGYEEHRIGSQSAARRTSWLRAEGALMASIRVMVCWIWNWRRTGRREPAAVGSDCGHVEEGVERG